MRNRSPRLDKAVTHGGVSLRGKPDHIGERLDYYLIEHKDDGHLDKERETSSGRVEALLLVKLHGFRLHLLLSRLIGASLVFGADRGDFRCERRLLYRILLLLDRQGKKYYLNEQSEESKRGDVASGQIVEKLQYASEEAINSIHHLFI